MALLAHYQWHSVNAICNAVNIIIAYTIGNTLKIQDINLEYFRPFSKLITQSCASIASYFVVVSIVFLMSFRASCIHPTSDNLIRNITVAISVFLILCCALDLTIRIKDTLQPKSRPNMMILWFFATCAFLMSEFTLFAAVDQLFSTNMTCENLAIKAK
ncbi:putative membrane protein [Yersinia aldovae 670-83]|nr:putative membrane protein [Yersinia aldovae 670-83]